MNPSRYLDRFVLAESDFLNDERVPLDLLKYPRNIVTSDMLRGVYAEPIHPQSGQVVQVSAEACNDVGRLRSEVGEPEELAILDLVARSAESRKSRLRV